MILKKMDKAIIFICVMCIAVVIFFFVEIIRGIEPQGHAISGIILIVINVIMVCSYLKHRHEYN